MVNFEEQLDFYINKVSLLAMRFARSDFSNYQASKLARLENRMKRELLRSYDYQKERGDAFHKLYQKSLDDTLKIITENDLDDKYLCY